MAPSSDLCGTTGYTATTKVYAVPYPVDLDDDRINTVEEYPETQWADNYDSDQDGLPDWWEELRGTNVNSPAQDFSDSNADADGDGYTELEHYLDFMAQPHSFVAPGQSATIEVRPLFAGFTNAPVYTAEVAGTEATATLSNGILTVTAGAKKAIETINIDVKDSDGAHYTRRYLVAITDNTSVVSGIHNVTTDTTDMSDAPFYDLSGRRVSTPVQHGIYIQNGKKVIK